MKSPGPLAGGVALVRFGSLGDLILATSAAKRLRAALPGRPIVFVTRHLHAPLLFRHPAIDRVIVLPPGHEGWPGLASVAGQLRREGVTGMIDLHANLRSRVLATLVRPELFARYDNRAFARRLLCVAPKLARRLFRYDDSTRVIANYAAAVDAWLRRAGVEPPGGGATLPSIELAPAEIAWGVNEVARLGLTPGGVGIAPGARHATKRWPIVYTAELIDRLAVRRGWVVPVFLSSSPDDLELETELRRLVRTPDSFRIVRQPVRRVAALLGRLATLVTNDSALMHLAAAVGTPVVALFGPTVTEFGFAPAGRGHRIMERTLDCRPCSVHGGPHCPKGHFRCLKEIAPEDLLEALITTDRRPGRATPGGGSDATR